MGKLDKRQEAAILKFRYAKADCEYAQMVAETVGPEFDKDFLDWCAKNDILTARQREDLRSKVRPISEEEAQQNFVPDEEEAPEVAVEPEEGEEMDDVADEVEDEDEAMHEEEDEDEGYKESNVIEIDGVKYAPVVSEEEEDEDEAMHEEEDEDEGYSEDLDLEAVLVQVGHRYIHKLSRTT